MTQCNQLSFCFGAVGRRKVVGRFDGGHISSFGGAGLLMMTERITGICKQPANCITDHRDPDLIEHPIEQLVARRLFAPICTMAMRCSSQGEPIPGGGCGCRGGDMGVIMMPHRQARMLVRGNLWLRSDR